MCDGNDDCNMTCHAADLPGFTRSVYERDHALIAPESRVWAGFPGWSASTAVGIAIVLPIHMLLSFAELICMFICVT